MALAPAPGIEPASAEPRPTATQLSALMFKWADEFEKSRIALSTAHELMTMHRDDQVSLVAIKTEAVFTITFMHWMFKGNDFNHLIGQIVNSDHQGRCIWSPPSWHKFITYRPDQLFVLLPNAGVTMIKATGSARPKFPDAVLRLKRICHIIMCKGFAAGLSGPICTLRNLRTFMRLRRAMSYMQVVWTSPMLPALQENVIERPDDASCENVR